MSTLSPARALVLSLVAEGRVAARDRDGVLGSYYDTTPLAGGWVDPGSTVDYLLDRGLARGGPATSVDLSGDWLELVVTDAGRGELERVAEEGRSPRSVVGARREALRSAATGRVVVVTEARRRLGFHDRSGPFSSTPFSWLLSRGLVEVVRDERLAGSFERVLEVTEVGRSVLTALDDSPAPPAPAAGAPTHDRGAPT